MRRLFTTTAPTALTLMLLLSADAATTVLSPLGVPTLTTEAAAADFTGKIKRIRIKRKRIGSGYRVISQTSGDVGGEIASVEMRIGENGGREEELEVIVLDIDVRHRLAGKSAPDDTLTGASTVTVFLSHLEDDDFDWDEEDDYTPEERARIDVVMVDGQGAGVGKGGQKVRVRVTDAGELRVVVSNEDGNWDPEGVASVGYTVDGKSIHTVSMDELRQKWASKLETDLSEYDDVLVETTLYDAKGAVLDTRTETVTLADDDEPGIAQIAVRQTNKGVAKLVTQTTSDGDAASLEVELIDRDADKVVLYTVDDTPVLTERTFLYSDIDFDPGESPEGYIYLCLIDLIGADGDPVGSQYEVELTVPSVPEGEEFGILPASFADGTGSVTFVNTGDGIHAVAALWHEDAAQVETFNLIFEEPFEGPAPLELEVGASVVAQKDKWIQKGELALPESYDLTATLLSAEGVELQSVFASGSGVGPVYKDDGGDKGTIVAGTVVTIGDKEVLLNIGF